jgi:hypothetical protein
LLNNFGIQSSEHFCLNFLRNFSLKGAKRNFCLNAGAPAHDVAARRHVGRAIPSLRVHAEAPENPAVRGQRR